MFVRKNSSIHKKILASSDDSARLKLKSGKTDTAAPTMSTPKANRATAPNSIVEEKFKESKFDYHFCKLLAIVDPK